MRKRFLWKVFYWKGCNTMDWRGRFRVWKSCIAVHGSHNQESGVSKSPHKNQPTFLTWMLGILLGVIWRGGGRTPLETAPFTALWMVEEKKKPSNWHLLEDSLLSPNEVIAWGSEGWCFKLGLLTTRSGVMFTSPYCPGLGNMEIQHSQYLIYYCGWPCLCIAVTWILPYFGTPLLCECGPWQPSAP